MVLSRIAGSIDHQGCPSVNRVKGQSADSQQSRSYQIFIKTDEAGTRSVQLRGGYRVCRRQYTCESPTGRIRTLRANCGCPSVRWRTETHIFERASPPKGTGELQALENGGAGSIHRV